MLAAGRLSPVVVGVLAPHFRLYFPPQANEEAAPDIWIANRLGYDAASRNGFSIRPIGRLKPGVAVEQAQAAADNVAAETRKHFLISGTAGYFIRIEPLQQHLVSDVRPAILALMGSAIFLLLIACANVGNLMLLRASLRERELAVRAALGGNRWRLLLPILTEAFLLAVAGTLAGPALAWIGVHELHALAPSNLPRLENDSNRFLCARLHCAGVPGRNSHFRHGAGMAGLATGTPEPVTRQQSKRRIARR